MSTQYKMKELIKKATMATVATVGFIQQSGATEVQTASLQALSGYSSVGTTTTDSLSAVRSETVPFAIQSLARSLGAGRTEVSASEYAERVFDYVRDNIETVPYYGLKKGSLGAYYDNEGTAFDQAMLMVDLLREDSLTAEYKLGTLTLTGAQFEDLYGLTDAEAACQMLADGGIPAKVNNVTSCGSVSGSVTSVIMDHIWVNYSSTAYDPSYKKHTLEDGVNLTTAMTGGGTTYSRSNFESDVSMDSTLNAWGNSYHTPDVSAAEDDLEDYAGNLVTAIKDTHYLNSMDEIIGGRFVDPVDQSVLGNSTGTLTTQATISSTNDIPNEYRTAIEISYGSTNKTIYADEIYGLRLWMDGQDLMVGDAVLVDNGGTVTTLTIDVDHPYAADSGNYADHSVTYDMSDLDSAAIVFATGSYSPQAARHIVNDAYQHSITDDDDVPDTETMARLAFAGNWQAQFGQLMKLNAAIASVTYQHHDSIGIIASDSSDNVSINIDTNLSVNADNGSTAERVAAYGSLNTVNNTFKASLIDQALNVGDDPIRTTASMMVEALDEGNEIWEINEYAPNQLDNVDGYTGSLITALKAKINASSSYLTGALIIDDLDTIEGQADAEPYIYADNGTDSELVQMITDLQGAFGTATEIGTAGDLLGGNAGDIIRDNSPQAVSGEYGDSVTDLVTGTGSFPMSLPYTRSFQQSRIDAPNKGWMHNYDITGHVASNAQLALSNPIAAAQAIVSLKVIHDMYVENLESKQILSAAIVENWLQNQLTDNTFTIRTAGGFDVYYKLADGTYEALSGSLASLDYVGGGTDEYTVTALSDSNMIFENVSSGEYRVHEMNWPNGIRLDFTYTANSLKVENNVFRYLNIYDTGADGDVDYVSDNAGRKVDYTYDGTSGYLEKAELIAWTTGAQTLYGTDTELLWQIDQSYNGTSDEWEVESKIATGPSSTAVINTHTLNRLGQMEKSVDAESNDSYFYPSQRRGETLGVTGGISTSFTNHQGLTYKTVDALGQEATSTFYSNGLLKRATAPEGNALEYTYDKYGQKTKERVYANNGSSGTDETEYLDTDYTYDTLANRLNLLTVATPDLDGAVANDNVTTYQYFTSGTYDGFLEKVIAPNVDVFTPPSTTSKVRPETTYAYTTLTAWTGGTLKVLESVTAPDGTVTKTTYDEDTWSKSMGLPVTVVQDYHATPSSGLNVDTHYTYDNLGNRMTGENASENKKLMEFNLRRQMAKTSIYAKTIPKWNYSGIGLPTLTNITTTYGNVFYDYDEAGRIEKVRSHIVSSKYDEQVTEYDDLGRVYKQKDDALDTVTYNYTETLGSQITVTAPSGFTNPILVSMVEVVDPVGRKVRAYTDILGRTIRTITAYNTVDEITEDRGYDDAGQLGWVKDGEGNVTEYTYDNYGRAVKTIYPDDSRGSDNNYTEASNYDDHGQPETLRKRDGSTFTLSYDAHGRVTQRIVKSSGGTTERTYDFKFDNMGRTLKAEVDVVGGSVDTITMAYDKLGRKTEETGDDGYGAMYAYDDEEGEVEITYDDPGSDTYKVTQQLDARGSIVGIIETRNSTDKTLGGYTFDTLGRLIQAQTGNDRKISYDFEEDGDLVEVKNELTSNYYDKVTYDYGHNAAGQVTSKDISTALFKWTPLENIENDYTINDLNQATNEATSIDGGSVTNTTVAWDNNGNMESNGDRDFTWSIENYLEEVEDSSTTIATYNYDAMGRRVSKTVGATTTHYIYSGGNVIAEYIGSTLERRYVYGPGVDRPIAMITPDGSGVDREYYHYDGQGSVIGLVDDSDIVTGVYSYDPYGKVDTVSGTSGNVYRYTGRRLDAETGLYYYRARYYDADMGRFLSADPIGYGDGLNMYAYVGGDPVNINDPSGMDAPCQPGRCQGYGRSGLQGSAASYAGYGSDPGSAMLRGATFSDAHGYSKADLANVRSIASGIGGEAVGAINQAHRYGNINGYEQQFGSHGDALNGALKLGEALSGLNRNVTLIDDHRGINPADVNLAQAPGPDVIFPTTGQYGQDPNAPITPIEGVFIRIAIHEIANGKTNFIEDGSVYKNISAPYLPKGVGVYKEHTVHQPGMFDPAWPRTARGNIFREQRRLVYNESVGTMYYTRNHYKKWIQLISSEWP